MHISETAWNSRGEDAENKDLGGNNCQVFNEELIREITKEKGCLDNSKEADHSISSLRLTKENPTLNPNNEN